MRSTRPEKHKGKTTSSYYLMEPAELGNFETTLPSPDPCIVPRKFYTVVFLPCLFYPLFIVIGEDILATLAAGHALLLLLS